MILIFRRNCRCTILFLTQLQKNKGTVVSARFPVIPAANTEVSRSPALRHTYPYNFIIFTCWVRWFTQHENHCNKTSPGMFPDRYPADMMALCPIGRPRITQRRQLKFLQNKRCDFLVDNTKRT